MTSVNGSAPDCLASSVPRGVCTAVALPFSGNVVLERRPKGNVGSPDDRYATRSVYDGRNLLDSETDGLGQTTDYTYDANGNRTRVEAPGAASAPGEDPEPRITETTYDGRDLPWSETTGAGSGQPRTTVTEFDGNGNLRREVRPLGVPEGDVLPATADDGGALTSNSEATKHATVMEYSADDLLLTRHLPWGERDAKDCERYHQDFHRDARGWVTELDSISQDGEARRRRATRTSTRAGSRPRRTQGCRPPSRGRSPISRR